MGMYFAVAIALEAGKNEPVLFRGDILQCCEQARALGYDAIEIHIKDTKQVDVSALARYCEKTDFRVAAFATGLAKRIDGLSFLDDDESIRGQAVQRVKSFIEAAHLFNAGVIIGSLRGNIPDFTRREIYDARFYSCMEPIAHYAEQHNVNVMFEVINRYENNYLNNAEETITYLDKINSENVKIHLDTFHMNIEETNMVQAIQRCDKRLGYIHLADNTRLAVGSGTIDFAQVINAVEGIGYMGALSLECLPLPSGHAAAKASIEAMNKLYTRH